MHSSTTYRQNKIKCNKIDINEHNTSHLTYLMSSFLFLRLILVHMKIIKHLTGILTKTINFLNEVTRSIEQFIMIK